MALATPTPAPGRLVAPAIGAAGLASLAILLLTLGAFGAGEQGLTLANRYLARLAFLIFLLPFSAGALRTLWPSAASRALLRQRRALGLAYATVQLTHAATIVALFRATPADFAWDVSVVGGSLGFVFVVALAATSNDAAERRLGGRAWARLHRTGIWYLWGIYVVTYVGRIAERDVSYAPLLLLALAGMGLRAAAARRRRRT